TLFGRSHQHRVRKVSTNQPFRTSVHSAVERKGHVASSTTKVEDLGIWLGKNHVKNSCRAVPPLAVHIHRKHVIQQVVFRRDRTEHIAHGDCHRGLVARTNGSGAQNTFSRIAG